MEAERRTGAERARLTGRKTIISNLVNDEPQDSSYGRGQNVI